MGIALGEEWRHVPGYEGLYEVSDRGRVHSFLTDTFLSPGKTERGHLLVDLRGKSYYVHHLVMSATRS